MSQRNRSEAYDLEQLEQLEGRPSLYAVKSRKRVAQEKQQQRALRRRFRKIVDAGLLIAIAVTIALMIVNMAELTELNDQIGDRSDQLAILESETIRLNNELAAKTSAESVEAYAKAHGMQKAEAYQIEYITVEDGDKAETPEEEPPSVWETIGEAIGGWFN